MIATKEKGFTFEQAQQPLAQEVVAPTLTAQAPAEEAEVKPSVLDFSAPFDPHKNDTGEKNVG